MQPLYAEKMKQHSETHRAKYLLMLINEHKLSMPSCRKQLAVNTATVLSHRYGHYSTESLKNTQNSLIHEKDTQHSCCCAQTTEMSNFSTKDNKT